MATWRALTERKADFARQTLAVFVPLAQRLSVWYFKTELETLALAILEPDEFERLQEVLTTTRELAAPALAEAQAELEAAIAADPVLRSQVRRVTAALLLFSTHSSPPLPSSSPPQVRKVKISSRVKDIFSVWRKMQRNNVTSVRTTRHRSSNRWRRRCVAVAEPGALWLPLRPALPSPRGLPCSCASGRRD